MDRALGASELEDRRSITVPSLREQAALPASVEQSAGQSPESADQRAAHKQRC